MAKRTYTVRWADGESAAVYTSRTAAMARVRARYPRAWIQATGYVYQEHPDLMCWATRAASRDDGGAKAVAVIEVIEVAS